MTRWPENFHADPDKLCVARKPLIISKAQNISKISQIFLF